jgi:hypothetical protein
VLLSVVLHLVPGPARAGRMVGRAESITTGDQVVFQDVDELQAFLSAQAGDGPDDDEVAGGGPAGDEPSAEAVA